MWHMDKKSNIRVQFAHLNSQLSYKKSVSTHVFTYINMNIFQHLLAYITYILNIKLYISMNILRKSGLQRVAGEQPTTFLRSPEEAQRWIEEKGAGMDEGGLPSDTWRVQLVWEVGS